MALCLSGRKVFIKNGIIQTQGQQLLFLVMEIIKSLLVQYIQLSEHQNWIKLCLASDGKAKVDVREGVEIAYNDFLHGDVRK